MALTNATGAIASSASYDSFGNATGNLATRYGYTGREKDATTGLMYYRNRWYDSNLGRFISEDPIGLAGGINQFGYVGGNPLSFTDPFGLEVFAVYNRQGYMNSEGAAEGSLTVFDFGSGNSFDPIVKVTTFEGGIFSGKDECINKTTCDTSQDKGPTPAGNYLIGEGFNVPRFNNTIGYPLYKSTSGTSEGPFPFQNVPVKDPITGVEKIREGGMYIHAGRLSLGCITFRADQNRGEPGYPSSKVFNSLDNILRKTSASISYNGGKFKGRLIVF